MMNFSKQIIADLNECIVESVAITCAICPQMIEQLRSKGFAEFAYEQGWRTSDDEPYCPMCVSEFLGGNNE